jgi:hypothetical protein
MRWLRTSLVGLLAVAGLAVAAVGTLRWVYLGPLPRVDIPTEAFHVDCHLRFLGFYRDCVFRIDEPYPSASVMEFFGTFLENKGWTHMTAADDHWISDSWIRFVDATVTPERVVDQYTASWQSPSRRHRAMLGVRYYESPSGLPLATAQVMLRMEPSLSSRLFLGFK